MAVTLQVVPMALLQARTAWDGTADALDAVWKRLARTEASGASSEVVGAFETFREQWVDTVKVEAGRAQEHADALAATSLELTFADRAQAERLRSLLGWASHDAGIVEVPR